MTHFNHDWDTTVTPAIPVATGDRYYAQDLNDDFNYLKHLPYEVFLQGRSTGVVIPPTDTWDIDTHTLTLTGGLGVSALNDVCLDVNEDFTVPPKTTTDLRYERIDFPNTVLTLPNDGNIHYIVATPVKKSFLQRTKALLSQQYASRTKYGSTISLQDSLPTDGGILIGIVHDDEYLLLMDNDPRQGKESFECLKWYGKNACHFSAFYNALADHYQADPKYITTNLLIQEIVSSGTGLISSLFKNSIIKVDHVSEGGVFISSGNFEQCSITVTTSEGTIFKGEPTVHYGSINIGTVSGQNSAIIVNGFFKNCSFVVNTIQQRSNAFKGGLIDHSDIQIGSVVSGGYGIVGGVIKFSTVSIGQIGDNSDPISSYGIRYPNNSSMGFYFDRITWGSRFHSSYGIYCGWFAYCQMESDGGLNNSTSIKLSLCHVIGGTSPLANTGGKLNVVNDAVLHAS